MMSPPRLALLLAAVITASAASAQAPPAFPLHQAPRELPELGFADADGRPLTLADFGGKVVLLNLWATWCAPCRAEMPTLGRLQPELGGPDFQAVALSVDRAGPRVVRDFYAEIGVSDLDLYIDASTGALRTLGAVGLPTTLLIDRDGRELGRMVGPAEWDAPEIVALLREVVARDPVPTSEQPIAIKET